MKRVLSLIISVCMIFGSFSIVMASENTIKKSNSKSIDFLDADDWEYIRQEEERLKAQGYVEVIDNKTNNISIFGAGDWDEDEIDGEADYGYWELVDGKRVRVCVVEKLYTNSEVVDDYKTMKNILTAGYNIAIGFISPYIWVPETLRQTFLSNGYQEGDSSLVMTTQKLYHYKYYKAYKDEFDFWDTCVRTHKLTVHTKGELSEFRNGRPILVDDSEDYKDFFTEHYSDDDWIGNEIDIRTTYGQFMVEAIDKLTD